MSIVRPDGALTVEFLLKEIADLKKQLADAHAVWESSERALVDRIKGRDLEIKDLIKEIFTLEEQKAQLWKELVDMGGADQFTAAEYFAGR